MKKLVELFKDPGVLFSTFHTITFAATAGLASPAFALGLLSLSVASAFKARQVFNPKNQQNLSNRFIDKKGAPMFVNGAILSSVAALSFATGAIVPALISTFFSVSNASKGLEMNGSAYSLKALGQKYFPRDPALNSSAKNAVNGFMRNTVFSAEFIASAGAFTVGLAGAGVWAVVGLGISASALTLATFSRPQQKDVLPIWRSLAHNTKEIVAQITPEQIQNALERAPILKNIRSLNISDTAMTRAGMACASASYGVASLLSDKQTAVALATGQVFAVAANARLAYLQHTVFDKSGAQPARPSAPQNLSVGPR